MPATQREEVEENTNREERRLNAGGSFTKDYYSGIASGPPILYHDTVYDYTNTAAGSKHLCTLHKLRLSQLRQAKSSETRILRLLSETLDKLFLRQVTDSHEWLSGNSVYERASNNLMVGP